MLKAIGVSLAFLAPLAAAPGCARATAPARWLEPHGSLRLQAEAVRPGNEQALADYAGARDACSRFGLRAARDLGEGAAMFAQAEIALDLANGRLRDPYDREEYRRVLRAGLRTSSRAGQRTRAS